LTVVCSNDISEAYRDRSTSVRDTSK
jgi:hypothetical protein